MFTKSKPGYFFGLVALALAVSPLSVAFAGQTEYTSFDVPDATYTIAVGINSA